MAPLRIIPVPRCLSRTGAVRELYRIIRLLRLTAEALQYSPTASYKWDVERGNL